VGFRYTAGESYGEGSTTQGWAALSNSARRYDSAVCCSKMSRDAFLGEALYEADE